MDENRKMLVWLGVLTLATMVFISYLALKVGGIQIGNALVYRLVFSNATGIPENADVRIAGIKVGSVRSMALAPEGGAEVWIGIEPAIAVYEDARAVIKSKSLLGERFIELQPGGKGARLAPGSTIADTVTPLRVEDLGEVLGPLVSSIDPSELSAALGTLVELIVDNREAIREGAANLGRAFADVSAMLGDPEQRQKLSDFLNAAASLTIQLDGLIGDNRASLSAALQSAGVTMGDLSALATHLRELSNEMPAASKDLMQILARLNRLLRAAEEFDLGAAGLVLKKVLQEEGLTLTLRGYSHKQLTEQIEGYKDLFPKAASTSADATTTPVPPTAAPAVGNAASTQTP